MTIYRFDRETTQLLDQLKHETRSDTKEQVIARALKLLQFAVEAERRGETMQFVRQNAEPSPREKFLQRIERAKVANKGNMDTEPEWDSFSET